MRSESLAFLRAIVDVPSPSGFEERAADIFHGYTRPFAGANRTDVHGNAIASLNPGASRRIMLAGHLDEIGFIVHHVDDKGLLFFRAIGGHDGMVPIGQRVLVHSESGPVSGVIGRKAIHLMKEEERKKKPELHELWIDIGAASKAEAEAAISLGDAVTYDAGYRDLLGGCAAARGFDNKVGAFVVAEALRLLADSGDLHPEVGVDAVGTVQEEIGLRGARTAAFGLEAEVGLAVDVNHATDMPSVSRTQHGALDLGKGPSVMRGANANPVVFRMIRDAAREEEIPHQVDVEGGATGTDGNAMQISRGGMAVGIVGVPLRYMHTPCEVLALTDVENCARLMAAFCRRVTPETDFTPRTPRAARA